MPRIDAQFYAGNLLLVEDDEVFRQRLAKTLETKGFAVVQASDVSAGHSCIDSNSFNFAVVDLRLPDGSGLEIVRRLGEKSPEVRTIVLTGFGSIASALEAVRLGAFDYLAKPAGVEQICKALLIDNVHEASVNPHANEVPSLARVEWEHINRVLSEVGGNISKAARLLGIHRRSLQRKLSKFPTRR